MLRKQPAKENTSYRYTTVLVFFMLVCCVFIYRLFEIQILQHERYKAIAQEQHWSIEEISAKRGDILSSDGYKLATTQISYVMYGEPKVVANPAEASYLLAEVLADINKYSLDAPFEYYQTSISQALSKDLFWVRLHSELTPKEKERLENLGIKGIGFEEEPMRYYPEHSLSSHVLGFVARTEDGAPQGYFGIEGRLNGDLDGRSGRIIEEQDALGAPILVGGYHKIDPVEGRNAVLTINRAVQYLVEQRLREGVISYGAKSGTVIVMDPFTGDVIAMANYPSYDPANFNDFSNEALNLTDPATGRKKVERTNISISQVYEPGSVMKALTVAAAVDLGKVNATTTFVDNGPVTYSGHTISNWNKQHHGVQTIVELLQRSNNIGAAWVGHLIGRESLAEYLRSFGYGQISGIDLEGEDTGVIPSASEWTDIHTANISFGQGISATPLQVLNSFNVLANGGELLQPRIVSKIIDGENEIEIPVTSMRRVISKSTSDQMIYMLTKSAASNEASFFNIDNYNIAGKTGTAQIPEEGRYNPSKTNATFVGFLSESKKFSLIVRLEEPTSSIYAAETAVPLWMLIADDLVKFYGISPDK